MTDTHDCYRLIDEALAAQGIRLSMCFQVTSAGTVLSTPRIPVEPIDNSRAAKKAARMFNMLASWCPFCGLELPQL